MLLGLGGYGTGRAKNLEYREDKVKGCIIVIGIKIWLIVFAYVEKSLVLNF